MEMEVRFEMIPTEYSSQFFILGFINFSPFRIVLGEGELCVFYCGSLIHITYGTEQMKY